MPDSITPKSRRTLRDLERKALWLAAWTVHHANHVRPKGDDQKVGGHQASSAFLASLMTVLYGHILRPEDRVAVKPDASPMFHALQYLMGWQTRDKLENFRSFGGAQSYPSRIEDADDVDFSTGSVGPGGAITVFASMVQDYIAAKGLGNLPTGRLISIPGDAELDESNLYEALLEGLSATDRDYADFLENIAFLKNGLRRYEAAKLNVPATAAPQTKGHMSTQEEFGKILDEIAKAETPLAQRIVTTAPDMATATSLGGWVNRTGVFAKSPTPDISAKAVFRRCKNGRHHPNGGISNWGLPG